MNHFPCNDDQYTDQTLLAMLRTDIQSEAALEEIFNRYHDRLYRIATGVLQNDALARDLVQEVFIDLWNRRNTRHIENLAGYLTQAIKFQVLKQIRNGRIRTQHLQLINKLQFVNQTEDLINFQELEEILAHSIEQLPPRCKEVFFLSRYHNLTNQEISSRLKISVKTVEGQITRALTFLRANLSKTMMLIGVWLINLILNRS